MRFLELLRQLVSLSYHKEGLGQTEIAKRIGISTGKLNSYLKGVGEKKRK